MVRFLRIDPMGEGSNHRTLSDSSNIFTEKAILHKYGRLLLFYIIHPQLNLSVGITRCDHIERKDQYTA